MKQILISTLIFFLAMFQTFAQKNEKLDLKNGFKDFSFGDLKSKYESLSGITLTSSDAISESYLYFDEEHNSLFGIEWLLLGLTFYTEELGKVTVEWLYEEETYDKLLDNLSIVFGEPYKMDVLEMRKADLIRYDHWEGEKVIMLLGRSDPSTVSIQNDRIRLIIGNKKIADKALENDF